MRQAICLLSFLILGGCATTPAVGRAMRASDLSLEQAQDIISAYEHRREFRHAEVASDPLGAPKSLDDVLNILRRDQLAFFPEAMKFLATQQGPSSLALRAQIELAWGEAQIILDEMLTRATVRLRAQANELELQRQAGPLSA